MYKIRVWAEKVAGAMADELRLRPTLRPGPMRSYGCETNRAPPGRGSGPRNHSLNDFQNGWSSCGSRVGPTGVHVALIAVTEVIEFQIGDFVKVVVDIAVAGRLRNSSW